MVADDASPLLRAAVLTDGDPTDSSINSGYPASMVAALDRHFALVHVEAEPFSPRFRRWRERFLRWSRGRLDTGWSLLATRWGTSAALRRLARARPDVVFVISQSPICALVADRHWTVNLSDATGASMVAYYPGFRRYSAFTRRRVVAVSSTAIRRAALSCFPSDWACQSAVNDCGGSPDRVALIEWGANLQPMPVARERTMSVPVRLLFVGYDGERKGGPDVVAAISLLRARGMDVELDVVGWIAEPRPTIDGVRWHGPIDKRDPEHGAVLTNLYKQAHLFVMPTRFEAYGIVFAEAAAYGLPSIALRTGGVPSVVCDGRTGLLLPSDSGADALAGVIADLVADPARYAAFSRAAAIDSAERLNWATWATRLASAVKARHRQDMREREGSSA